MFSFIVGQLYTFAPFLVDVHFALRQLHHDVRGLEAGVVGQVGTDAESAANFAATVFLYVEGFAEVQGIAEYDCLGSGVYAQFAIAGNQLVGKLELISGVTAHTVEELCLLAA